MDKQKRWAPSTKAFTISAIFPIYYFIHGFWMINHPKTPDSLVPDFITDFGLGIILGLTTFVLLYIFFKIKK